MCEYPLALCALSHLVMMHKLLVCVLYSCFEVVLVRDHGAIHTSNLGIRSKESYSEIFMQLRMTEVEKGSMLQLSATWVSQS